MRVYQFRHLGTQLEDGVTNEARAPRQWSMSGGGHWGLLRKGVSDSSPSPYRADAPRATTSAPRARRPRACRIGALMAATGGTCRALSILQPRGLVRDERYMIDRRRKGKRPGPHLPRGGLRRGRSGLRGPVAPVKPRPMTALSAIHVSGAIGDQSGMVRMASGCLNSPLNRRLPISDSTVSKTPELDVLKTGSNSVLNKPCINKVHDSGSKRS